MSLASQSQHINFDDFLHSLQQVVFVAQRMMAVESFQRQPNGPWLFTAYESPDDSLLLPGIQASIPLSAIYRNIELEP